MSAKPTFSIDFHGGYGEPFPLAKLAELFVGTDWTWARNNGAKHLVVFIDTRDNRLCRVYDREHRAMTFDELARQHGQQVKPETFEAADLHLRATSCVQDSYAFLCRELDRKQGMIDDLKQIAVDHHGLTREDELTLIQSVKDRDNLRQALAALRSLYA